MSSVLWIFIILSICAVAVATYVFTVAARNYVSDAPAEEDNRDEAWQTERVFVERSGQDRRHNNNVIQFPMTLPSGEVILHDRRTGERRANG